MIDRRSNFKKNLNYLKENKGFSVPFIAGKIDAEKRTVEKWFYENKLPNGDYMTKLLTFLESEFGITENDLFGRPDKEIGIGSSRALKASLTNPVNTEEIAEAVAKKLQPNEKARRHPELHTLVDRLDDSQAAHFTDLIRVMFDRNKNKPRRIGTR